jgi:hypothetical protein
VSICNRIMTGLRFLLRVTLRRPDLAAEIYHIREPQKIPLVMSQDETPPAGGGHQSQGSHAAQSRLWLRAARRRGGQAEGQGHADHGPEEAPPDHTARSRSPSRLCCLNTTPEARDT